MKNYSYKMSNLIDMNAPMSFKNAIGNDLTSTVIERKPSKRGIKMLKKPIRAKVDAAFQSANCIKRVHSSCTSLRCNCVCHNKIR